MLPSSVPETRPWSPPEPAHGSIPGAPPTRLRATRCGLPPADWKLSDTFWTERYLDRPQDNPDGYRDSSALTYAANLADRLLIIHGLADDSVHPQNTIAMSGELVKAGRPFEQALYPGQEHRFRGESLRHLYARMTEFFERELQRVD